MKELKDMILEASGKMWVAIEDDFEGDNYSKPRTSYRVVSAETYADLKRGYKYGKGNKEIPLASGHTYSELGRSSNREEAESYLPQKQAGPRKTPIDKRGMDYIVYAISIGKISPSGATKFGYAIWDQFGQEDDNELPEAEIYVIEAGWESGFLIGARGSLNDGDKVIVVDNDTQHKLGCCGAVSWHCACTHDAFAEAYRKHHPGECKRPGFAFGHKTDGLPWTGARGISRFGGMYSIKGITQ